MIFMNVFCTPIMAGCNLILLLHSARSCQAKWKLFQDSYGLTHDTQLSLGDPTSQICLCSSDYFFMLKNVTKINRFPKWATLILIDSSACSTCFFLKSEAFKVL